MIIVIDIDFWINKILVSGIPYLTLSGEEKMRAKLDEKLKQQESLATTPNNRHVAIPNDQKEFMQSIL